MAEAAAGPAMQAEKAASVLTSTTRNLLLASVLVILSPAGVVTNEAAKIVGQELGHGIADGLVLREKARRMTENAADAVGEIIRAAPPDLRHGLAPLQSPQPHPNS